MAKKRRKLTPKELQEDLDAYAGLQGLTDYAPQKDAYSLNAGRTILETRQASETDHIQKIAAEEASRDKKVEDQWAFRDWIRNMRIQVKAQYGEDSDEVVAVGLKKKSEYKSPKPKKPTE